jgi:YVTN family beta-propeller protein
LLALTLGALGGRAQGPAAAAESAPAPVDIYAHTHASDLSPAVAGHLERIYVPNLRSGDVSVIDPATLQVVDRFPVGIEPQHVVPSWDLQTLWVANNAEHTKRGSLTPIDPRTGKPGKPIEVDDPYNLYFSPDGHSAIVVAEARRRLDFRDAHTMALQYSIDTPTCGGINHADFSPDGGTAYFTCEFEGALVRVDLASRKVTGTLRLHMPAAPAGREAHGPDHAMHCMPQDVRSSPDGSRLYVADMEADGLHVIDAKTFTETGFIASGKGAHGLYPSRDGRMLYIANRGSHKVHGGRHGDGGVTVMEFGTEKIVAHWLIPGGGSPDMGNVSADGRWLWLSGRFDDVVYRFDTTLGTVRAIPVGLEPHGLAVWPQPGRYSLGHTGNLR